MNEAQDDDQTMTRYLLGDLSPAEQERVLDRIETDEAYFEALCAFEDELIQRYHRSELSDAERKLFRAAYSSTPARRRRVADEGEFLDAMRDAKTAEGVGVTDVARPPLWQRAREWLVMPRLIPNFAVAGATLAVLGAVSAATYSTVFAPASATRVTMAFQLSSADGQRRAATGGLVEPGREPASQPATPTLIVLPADVTDVRLLVDIGPAASAADALEVTLGRDGGSVATAGRWRVSGTAVVLTVPARELIDGEDYTLTVGRGGQGVDLAARAFRVRRE